MEHKQQIKNYCHQFKITGISTSIDHLLTAAQQQNKSYLDFIISLFEAEAPHRQQNEFKRRLKALNFRSTVTWMHITMALKMD